jgi:hypothetical protein
MLNVTCSESIFCGNASKCTGLTERPKADMPAAEFMPSTLTIHDATTSGQKTNTFTLDCLTEKITVRELIRARIYQEVNDYNQKEPEYFRGLVEPTNAERVLNGYKLKAKRKIDWEDQYKRALEAFGRNGFFLLVGDKQAESLDQEFQVKVDTEVSFVKLVPLVGG